MNFANMKVGMRLGLGFALVILAGLVVAVFGSIQLDRANAEVTSLVDDRMVKVELAGDIQDNLNVVARAVRNIALTSDEAVMQAEKQRIGEARTKNTELIQKLDQILNLPEGRAIMKKISDIRPPYNESIDKAVALGLANRSEEARDVLVKENRPLQAAYFKALGELSDLQKRLMNDSAKQVQSIASTTGTLMLIIAAVAAVLGGLIAWALTRSITRQLGGEPDYASNVAREIAAGNLAVEVQVATGDTSSLLAAMKAMRDSLAKVVSTVRTGSEGVSTASSEIAQGNHDLSARTEQQASALEETAASMEELSSTVKQNADNARQANQLSISASSVAVKGGAVVAQVVDTMKGINDSSKKISDIISVIDGIAFQTNILALNAAVEAARAGEQGRGFAVVASEVRSLAGRSADAAKEIKSLINASVERVEQGTLLVDQAGVTMAEVVSAIKHVTDLMGEISAASNEQSQGVSQIGEAVQQMDQVTQQNAALVEEMAAAASSLQSQAQDLVATVEVFKLSSEGGSSGARSEAASAPSFRPVSAAPAPKKLSSVSASRVGNSSKASFAKAPARQALSAPAATQTAKAGGDGWDSF
ncbi:MAG: MCP four helix bundle domain-containing protein [Gammaproteobacteria bacterium]|uniref:methyl-accepting chemotaxis protein n=1 Tax=Rhodoferax sp. TaxID=50421 RepID=UPI00183045A7|nr:methyl-accepting chemotaxis protein [Rhodoferax sp.]MBU3897409.1 MCP four helix bundle domain-containing protein [Gammaproteobacteria bacterium]MBA3057131.1 methyl-accepting chemotaxis protein [Rhodoferax sp.]MBU3999288.1 MCP four helix bundle domain-containing protein [Gammaproteobacteria bacterium]MBU4018755.1 MCP four helix bundle domain-containing protein [Gammaproteobacteria bacterium]MBU4079710.1 MCP four helix bundle domain-containing protein [Gammaproteobacteria bacterium]